MSDIPDDGLPGGIDPRGAQEPDASQWRLIWIAFRRNKLAVIGAVLVVFLYVVAIFVEFLSPFDPNDFSSKSIYHPPQAIVFFDTDAHGETRFRPHVIGTELTRDPVTLEGQFAPDPGNKIYLRFLGRSWEYSVFGLFTTDIHLLAPATPGDRFILLGADRLGRDMLSRTIAGTRVSMSIGLVGVALTLFLGLLLGGISGYFGGYIDSIIQRTIEIVLSLPTIPIWLGLSAAMPLDWSPLTRYFAITILLSLIGWTELARVVRGRFLSLRSDDFVIAARLDGASRKRVIFRHMMPSLTSHIIATLTLAIPNLILAETALSFLGLGLLPPAVSWGVLLQEVQNVRSIAQGPWLFVPAGLVVIAVLAFNFLGDGLRDAADPYAQGRG
jgi:peptide/nickel transport system permease protein